MPITSASCRRKTDAVFKPSSKPRGKIMLKFDMEAEKGEPRSCEEERHLIEHLEGVKCSSAEGSWALHAAFTRDKTRRELEC